MSSARNTFCAVTARGNGAWACPRKYGMNWFIPALVRSSPDSGGGISDDEGTRLCPRSSKKRRNDSRISRPSIQTECTRGPGSARKRAGEASFVPRPTGSVAAELVLGLAHRRLALLDRLREQLRDVHDPAARLPGKRGRSDLAGLATGESHRHDRAGGPRADAERDPERPSQHGGDDVLTVRAWASCRRNGWRRAGPRRR